MSDKKDEKEAHASHAPHTPAKASAPKKSGQRFVILHGAVGAWNRGDLVDAEKFGDDESREANIDRLVRLNAMREATADERDLDHVTIVESGPQNISFEQEKARLEAENERLQAALAISEEKCQLLKAQAQAGMRSTAPEQESFTKLAKEKDRVVDDLRKQNDELRKQVEAKQAETGEATQAQAGHEQAATSKRR